MPSRALLTEAQTISAAEVTQALSNIGIARVSLSAPVTRTSATGTTLTNTGLTALTVSLLPSSRYRLTYRLFVSGSPGFRLGFTFPSSLAQFDGIAIIYDIVGGAGFYIYADWPNNGFGNGDPIQEANADPTQNGGLQFTVDITTGATANTYGDFAVIFAQQTSNAAASTMSQNSCVEVLKF